MFEVGDKARNKSYAGDLTVGVVYEVFAMRRFAVTEEILVVCDTKREDWYSSTFFEKPDIEIEVMRVTPPIKPRPFWMVKGSGPTSYEHNDEQMARTEAERLAKEHPGCVFTVLGPVAAYQKSDVQITDLTDYLESGDSGDVPF